MRKLVFALLFMAVMAGAAMAASVVPGDVLVIFNNPFPDVPVTAESLFKGSDTQEPGVHAAYINEVAQSLDAKVTHIYETLSVEGGNITALFHTDSKSEGTLWVELRMRKDVKGASLNYVRGLNVIGKSRK